jgi:glutamate racemase
VTSPPPVDIFAPLGVFDSGLGGLTVVRCLREALPQERIVYVADQIHVPYGGRDLDEVRGFACGISEALLGYGCKAIVMACNISSATALPIVQAAHPDVPILGMIHAGTQAAVQQTRSRRIGVLATEGTVRSGAYTRTLHALDSSLQVTEVVCPAFVPLVEAGQVDTPAAYAACEAYLTPLRAAEVDVVILGCTHYPFLLPTLRSLCNTFLYIDPAEQTARDLAVRLANARLLAPSPHRQNPPSLLSSTGDATTFAAQVCRFLPDSAHAVQIAAAHWENGALFLPS